MDWETAPKIIEHRYFGGTEHISVGELADFVGDDEVALEIAEYLLAHPDGCWEWNEDQPPELYGEFGLGMGAGHLREQIDALKEEMT